MATLIHPTESFEIPSPTSLRDFRALVGGYPEFIRFADGSYFVKGESRRSDEPMNHIASALANLKGFPETFRGRVVFLSAAEAGNILPVGP